jgi:hypothetical protein
MDIGYILLYSFISVYIFGVLFSFFRPVCFFMYNDRFPENVSSNICLIFFDALLWPGDIFKLCFGIKEVNTEKILMIQKELGQSDDSSSNHIDV